VRRLGGGLHDTGTRLAVEFTKAGASGGKLSLGGGIWFRRDLERLRVVRGEVPLPERPASVPGPGEGKDRAMLGGQAYDVVWDVARTVGGEVPRGGSGETTQGAQSFAAGLVAFPLTVRSWRPGDRMRLAYGSKKLKKLFLEARVPTDDRSRIPVLVDAAGSVLWVPGVARSVEGVPGGDGIEIHIHITHAESD